ncbi:MAG: hypothetical protein QF662_01375 [Phycisphaerae bacterium]|nr:hypothetical protein [Phycisphaerae bacterium]
MTETLAIALAALAGVFFAILGIAYRLGQSRKVPLVNVVLVSAALGALFFGLQSIPLLRLAPWRVYAWGVAAGFTQYWCIKGIAAALRRGQLSPVWCAMNLAFVPAIIYAYFALGETLNFTQAAAIASAIACVAVASAGPRGTRGPSVEPLSVRVDLQRPVRTPGGKFLYGAILLLILVSNSVTNMGLKALSVPVAGGPTDMEHYRSVFLACIYLSLMIAVAVEIIFTTRSLALGRWTLGLGAMAAGGSIAGLSLLAICARWAAADVFPAVGVSSILVAAVVSVLAFRESPGWMWLATVALGLLSVVLVFL